MRHLDLFSGIGGFALAADEVFGDVEHVFCDNEPFSQAILKKHWPNSYIHDDIRIFTADTYKLGCLYGKPQEQSAEGNDETLGELVTGFEPPFLLTGGFPCQPFSQAGQRRGTEDDRFLWPEMLRVIRELRPTWVIAENVRGLLTQGGGVVFEQVCSDLEGEGYDVQPLVIPAVAVNAPHRRDRVWFIANDTRSGLERSARGSLQRKELGLANGGNDDPNTNGEGCEGDRKGRSQVTGLGGLSHREGNEKGRDSWDRNWIEVATRLCPMDDGLPNGLVRPKGWRNAALKAAGNAIVPQVAIEIMKSIKHAS